jgi:hypothetical protein
MSLRQECYGAIPMTYPWHEHANEAGVDHIGPVRKPATHPRPALAYGLTVGLAVAPASRYPAHALRFGSAYGGLRRLPRLRSAGGVGEALSR